MTLKNAHNMQVIPEYTYFDGQGTKIKSIIYPPSDMLSEQSNIELTVYNKDGSISDKFIVPFRSFTGRTIQAIEGRYMLVSRNIRGTTNILHSQASTRMFFAFTAPAGTVIYGIAVGSGINTASIDDYTMQTRIAHGTGAGQLSYGSMEGSAPYSLDEVSGSLVYSCFRTFTNNSAGNVTIREVGLQGINPSSLFYFLIARDRINSNGEDINVVISPTQVLTVKYNIFFPNSAGFLRNYAQMFFLETQRTSGLVKDYPKSSDTIDLFTSNRSGTPTAGNYMAVGAGAGTYLTGIAVGSGDAPFNIENHRLDNIIIHGSGSNELLYGAVVSDLPSYVYSATGSAGEFTLRRTFTNANASPVTVRESGLIGFAGVGVTNLNINTEVEKALLLRNLTGDQEIASGSSLEIAYKFRVSA